MLGLIDEIEMFNRKERYFLLSHALAQPRDEDGIPRMRLSEPFAERLSRALDGMEVKAEARCWMDYHMDWLYASLLVTSGAAPPYQTPFLDKEKVPYRLNQNQEDIDLIVAFDSPKGTVLLLVEAKGYGSWNKGQLLSKARRLECIFGRGAVAEFDRVPIVVRFVMASSSEPPFLPVGSAWEGRFPPWMSKSAEGTPYWLPMKLPPTRLRPVSVPEDGQKPSDSLFWRVKTLSTKVDRRAE